MEKRNKKETKKQKKTCNPFILRLRVKPEPHIRGTMIEEVHTIFAQQNFFASNTVSLLRGAES